MNRCRILFLLLCLASAVWAMDLNDPAVRVKLEQGEIVTEVGKVPGTRVLTGQTAGVIDAPIEQVWAVLSKDRDIAEYMPRMKESFLVSPGVLPRIADFDRAKDAEPLLRSAEVDSSTSDTIYEYDVFDFPFPVSDRRCLVRTIYHPDSFRSDYEQIVGDFKVNQGGWELYPFSEGRTLAVYSLRTDPGIAIPVFLIRLGTRYALPGVIKGLRRWVEDTASGKR